MALDKQRILSELGSVMNQLQSADCGCMGKLFSNPNEGCAPSGNPLPTCGGCRRGCCRGHGYGVHYNNMAGGGEPYSMNGTNMAGGGMHAGGMHSNMHGGMHGGMQGGGMHGGSMFGGMPTGGMSAMDGGTMPSMNQGMPCMGRNAPKLYADTYNYLNQNLMQPLVKEVYDDLRSITPANTIGHNPLAAKMGIPLAGAPTNAPAAGNSGLAPSAASGQISEGAPVSSVNPMISGELSTGGMMGGPGSNLMNNTNGQMNGMGAQIANMMLSGGRSGASRPAYTTGREGQESSLNAPQATNGLVANPGAMMQNPQVAQDKFPEGNAMVNSMPNQPIVNKNQTMPQMANGNTNPYGQHSAGMKKFNEMFPGVMQGDLNFDPMAIAIQMNPANQQKAAMDTMNKLMSNNGIARMQPAVAGANTAMVADGKPTDGQTNKIENEATDKRMLQQPTTQQPTTAGSNLPLNNQQVYTALTATPMANQQIPQPQMQGQQIDPNTGAVINQNLENSPVDPNAQQLEQPQENFTNNQEPIHPVDTSKNATVGYMMPQYTYNTLGQPIELLNPNTYQSPQSPSGPQTLYGGIGRPGYNVKNTISKTRLAGNIPAGVTASRSQLQHIYRQYKASHSATQQNIRPPPVQGGSASEGHLTVNPALTNANGLAQQIPVEKVGGDSLATNPNMQMAKVEQNNPDQVGDVPKDIVKGDTYAEKSPGAVMQKRGRNGLQDMSFTPYRATTGWSFHG